MSGYAGERRMPIGPHGFFACKIMDYLLNTPCIFFQNSCKIFLFSSERYVFSFTTSGELSMESVIFALSDM